MSLSDPIIGGGTSGCVGCAGGLGGITSGPCGGTTSGCPGGKGPGGGGIGLGGPGNSGTGFGESGGGSAGFSGGIGSKSGTLGVLGNSGGSGTEGLYVRGAVRISGGDFPGSSDGSCPTIWVETYVKFVLLHDWFFLRQIVLLIKDFDVENGTDFMIRLDEALYILLKYFRMGRKINPKYIACKGYTWMACTIRECSAVMIMWPTFI